MQLNNKNLSPAQNKSWYKKWWIIVLFIIITLFLIFAVASMFYIANEVKKLRSSGLLNQQILDNTKYTELIQQIFNGAQYTQQRIQEVEGGDSSIDYLSDEREITNNRSPAGYPPWLYRGPKNYWIGASNPKITIVEFVDFSCPLCKNSFTKIREISLKYKKDVKIIFRDYPMYEHSLDLAMAARCAGEQGLFWLMHDKLFQNQGMYEKNQLSELANQIGADVNKFNNCFTNKKYLSDIKNDFTDAEKLEVAGTPTWFINGAKVAGDIPYGLFVEIVEELIKE